MWEKELELIESLGKLYPEFYYGIIEYKNYRENNFRKSQWISWMCVYRLNRRLPQLEEFIKENGDWVWDWYKANFNIKNKQCGKEN